MNTTSGFSSLQLLTSKPYRKIRPGWDNCRNEVETCHPEDIVINGLQQSELDAAIASNSISELFSDEATALQFVPDWNTTWFADVKTAILSGDYTFLETGNSVYLLGKQGAVSTTNFEYAIQYKVQ